MPLMEVQVKSKNKIFKPKLKARKKGGIFLEILKDYCSHASLHGIGYLGAKDKTLIEKRKFFWDVSLICNLDYFAIFDDEADKTTNEEAIKNILKVASQNFVEIVTWQYEYMKTEEFFSPQITDEGICFTSNSFSQKDMYTDKLNQDIPFITHNRTNCGWSIENGYPKGLDLQVYPRRTAQDGYISGLSVTLKKHIKQQDYVCGIPISGYKLILHNPAEMPRPLQKYILIPLNRQVTISVQPELLKTSDGLSKISPKIRNCYYSHEKSLMFFKIYTQSNCQLECLANVTEAYCGCVSFFQPRDNNTLICGFGHTSCIQRIRDLLHRLEIMQKENAVPEDKRKSIEFQIYEKCNCLPACSSLYYNAETSQATGHFLKTMEASGENPYTAGDEVVKELLDGDVMITQVDIFFKQNHIIAVERSELFGQTDFLANCGGLLGLFLGFSLLSIVEIVYFLTIRVYFKLKQTKEEEKLNYYG